MITYRQITEDDFLQYRADILRLIKLNADNHITRRALNNFRRLRPEKLSREGNVIWTAWDGELLVGMIFCERYGNRTSFSVVRRSHRSQGIAKALLRRAVNTMGRFYAEVAADNPASLKVLFGMGMVAYDVFPRRGKWILRVRNGFDVNKE
ncbi:MAG: GNAT family N-acetyltransferase [Firmicutes bacterium]|nr:GNAT family N-acetyltransferase [Bacillota bacterium]